jgi:hypothetical protein
MASKYLVVYLNDHLSAATGAVELAKRMAKQYDGTDVGRLAGALRPELEADRDALLDVMRTVGARVDRAKVAAGWAAEKAGRLKLNGQLRGSSPLSPLVELEGLLLILDGNRRLWEALEQAPEVAGRIGAERLRELRARSERQIADAEHARHGILPRALTG